MTTRWKYLKVALLPVFWMAAGIPPCLGGEVVYLLNYSVTIPSLPGEGKQLRLWIPYPPDSPAQRVLRSEIHSPFPWKLKKEEEFGNRLVYIEAGPTTHPWVVRLELEVARRNDLGMDPEVAMQWESFHPEKHRGATPWIPFSETIQQIAERETRGKGNTQEKIRALNDYVYKTMRYDKRGKGWGNGDPIWACANRRGNCTDFHSLFIALARSQNIAARFEIGLPLSAVPEGGEISGYHCWAQVFDPVRGWIPLDISESKKAGLNGLYFGRLPPDRILLGIGRGIRLNPPQEGDPVNILFAPYSEVDGKVWKGAKARYFFKRYSRPLTGFRESIKRARIH